MHPLKCVIIGAGAIGTNAALFLDALGVSVDLIEAQEDILLGAPQVSFINHADGFEYFKPGYQRTGEYCVEGSLTKALFYPLAALATSVCTVENPIRFLVSQGSVADGRISTDEFMANAVHMCGHYTRMYQELSCAAGLRGEEAESIFVRRPETFLRFLERTDYADVRGVVAGACGIGFGINMPHYYALLRSALRASGVKCHFNTKVDAICKQDNGDYELRAHGGRWDADFVLVCNAHHIPDLASKIKGIHSPSAYPGTFHLNALVFLRLPKTGDSEKLRLARKITFTLMEEHGCMVACVLPPTPQADGLAAVYYPSPRGSQLASHSTVKGSAPEFLEPWENILQNGLPENHPNVQACCAQACRLHPFLNGYVEFERVVCRTVFNIGVPGSDNGRDRRVRELSRRPHCLTADGRVSAWTGPKWTNAELAALMAADYVLRNSGNGELPKSARAGCGPTSLNVGQISQQFHFRHLKMQRSDVFAIHEVDGIADWGDGIRLAAIHRMKSAGAASLIPAIGRWSLAALIINSVVGAGIFGLPSNVARQVGTSAPWAYLLGALMTAITVSVVVELGSQFREPGGAYLYVREAFGSFVGLQNGVVFLVGEGDYGGSHC